VAASLFGDWKVAREALDTLDKGFKKAADRAMLKEAHFLKGKIVQGFRDQAPGGQAFAPLAKSTLAIRKAMGFGGTKALIERGDLRNSITVIKTEGGIFIGVSRSAKSRDGKGLINVAKAHEEGTGTFAVPITEKSSAWYHMMLRRAGIVVPPKGGGGHRIMIIKIPARPFIRPVFEKYGAPEGVRARFYANITRDLAGPFGVD
jgi:hypothetical protein